MSHARHCRSALVLGLIFLLAGSAASWAQTGPAHLVKDINTTLLRNPSSPSQFVEFKGLAYFSAFTVETGRELFKSDGTDAGTSLVKDIAPGPQGSSPTEFVAIGDTLFFFAGDGVHGQELWKSDGTAAGTVMVKDIFPGAGSSAPYLSSRGATPAGGLLFFVANDGVNGEELWKSDGTESGTTLVKDILPGPGGGSVYQIRAVDGVVLFPADDGVHGSELWRSDGTEAGTYMLVDLQPGPQGSYPSLIGGAGNVGYFSAEYGFSSYNDLWKSDGTLAGTSKVTTLTDLYSSRGVEYAGQLFFQARSYSGATQLWKTDGSAIGTRLVVEYPVGAGIMESEEFQGLLYFIVEPPFAGAPSADAHIELWRTSAVGAPTHVKDLRVGTDTYNIFVVELTALQDVLVFRSYDDAHGFELWRSDGTEVGTVLFDDIIPGAQSSFPGGFAAIAGKIFFATDDGVHSNEPWKTNGTAAGTALVKDINTALLTDSSYPGQAVALGGKAIFNAYTPATGNELWESDGTEAGTFLLKDIMPGYASSYPYSLTVAGGKLFFVVDDGIHGYELWKTDGTEAGTMMVKDIQPGSGPSYPDLLNEAYGLLFFTADDGVHGVEMWRSDGTEAGTYLVKDINPGPASSYPLEAPGENPVLLFDANDGIHGYEPWTSDGTEAGTTLLKDINPGPASSYSDRAYKVNGTYLFFADDGVHGPELWKTDLSEAGTQLFKDIIPGEQGSYAREIAKVGETLFFTDGDNGFELWQSDGSEEGTHVVMDNLYADSLRPGGGILFFRGYDPFEVGLWRTDGTEGGTIPLLSSGAFDAQDMTAADGTLFFSGLDPDHGYELWRSDGTAEGTVLAQDLVPGTPSGAPRSFALVGSRLFFVVSDVLHGEEPWAGRVSILANRPDRAIQDLRGELQGLGLPQGIERGLTAKLNAAEAGLARGTPAVTHQLEAFIRQVDALTPKFIDEAASASLIEFAQEIVDLIGGTASAPLAPVTPTGRRAPVGFGSIR